MNNFEEELGPDNYKKAMMHGEAMKQILDSKGVDAAEFLNECVGEGSPMEENMSSEEPDSGEVESMDMEPKKAAIIIALKKKMGEG